MVRVTEAQEEEKERRTGPLVLYPAYWDAKRTVAAGRKVPASLAVEYPTVQDVAECCAYLGLAPQVEQKAFCRDVLTQPVRLRVALNNESGILINPQVPTRKALYTAVGNLLKEHPGRLHRAGFIKQQATPTGQLANVPPSLHAVALVAVAAPPGADGAGPAGGAPPDKKEKKKGKKG